MGLGVEEQHTGVTGNFQIRAHNVCFPDQPM